MHFVRSFFVHVTRREWRPGSSLAQPGFSAEGYHLLPVQGDQELCPPQKGRSGCLVTDAVPGQGFALLGGAHCRLLGIRPLVCVLQGYVADQCYYHPRQPQEHHQSRVVALVGLVLSVQPCCGPCALVRGGHGLGGQDGHSWERRSIPLPQVLGFWGLTRVPG